MLLKKDVPDGGNSYDKTVMRSYIEYLLPIKFIDRKTFFYVLILYLNTLRYLTK